MLLKTNKLVLLAEVLGAGNRLMKKISIFMLMYCFHLEIKGINTLVISVTNLSYYKDYSLLGLYKIHGKACNSAVSQ